MCLKCLFHCIHIFPTMLPSVVWILKTLITFFLTFSLTDLNAIRCLITMILTNESQNHLVAHGLL